MALLLSSEINIWYLDNAILGGPAESVFSDVRKCVTDLNNIGLEVHPSKCEVINMSYPVEEFTELVTTLTPDLQKNRTCRYGATRFSDSRPGSIGRLPRHTALNDVIRRSRQCAGIPALFEPADLYRGDGNRPNGITLFPLRKREVSYIGCNLYIYVQSIQHDLLRYSGQSSCQ